MRDFLRLTKALADATRVRMIMALRGGELCVCQVTALLGLAPSTVSRHLSLLHQAGLVASRREGRWTYYRLAGPRATVAVREALDWVNKATRGLPEIREDVRRVRTILTRDPSELCA